MTQVSALRNLSSRGENAATSTSPPFIEVINDPYSELSNPTGYLSLGLAENILMHQELEDYIAGLQIRLSSHDLTYGDRFSGSQTLRATVARFINRHFHPVLPTTASQIIVTAGVTNAIEVTAWSLANPGEGILLGRPYYTAFINDMQARAEVKTVTVSFHGVDPFSLEAVDEYERALRQSQEDGIRIRALMLCSPHNPLGRCYPRRTLISLMKLCQRYQIHLISDEIYALSVWRNREHADAVKFTSVLSIELTGVIDASLVHVLWGMSKDFGANGLRLGLVISQSNPHLLASMRSIALFTCPSSATEYIAIKILEDDLFTHKYIATNQQRIAESYAFITDFLRFHSVTFYPGANAAFFIWCNLKEYFVAKQTEDASGKAAHISRGVATVDDKTITQRLMANKVFIASGADFGSEEPGWFRIVFTHPRSYLEEGLKRMIEALAG